MDCLRKTLLLLLPLAPAALSAQSVISISTNQCVWHTGDDPRWASPSFSDSAWQPYSGWTANTAQPHLWVRCHTGLGALHSFAHPAIQVSLLTAYQLYLNGTPIGAEGDLRNGRSSLNAIRTYPVPLQFLASTSGSDLLALRITDRSTIPTTGPIRSLLDFPLQIRGGDAPILDALRASTILTRSSQHLRPALYFGIVGVIAVMTLGLYFYDRTRSEFLLLSVACLSLTSLRFNEFAMACLAGSSVSTSLAVALFGNIGLTLTQIPFFYAVARKRIPVAYIVLLAFISVLYFPTAVDVLVAANQPTWIAPLNFTVFRPLQLIGHAAISLAPFFAFWPFAAIRHRIRPLAALCMLWGAADFVWFAVEITSIPIPGVPNLFAHWDLFMLSARGFTTACVLAALLALLFREQRQVSEERAILAGEMQAAGDIQRMLAPSILETAPGLLIEVAFRPMREVGGDFYQCRVLPDGRQRLLVGDVSGKGTGAAMAAALILGGAAARDSDSPAELLAHLNRVLHECQVGGFATCLCTDVAPDGSVQFANAGHLSPYCCNKEVAMQPGLPLGLILDERYQQIEFELAPGSMLTFLSDGVVEARDSTGTLFGFERTLALSSLSASAIADAAQSFGQEDDITVLTLARSHARPGSSVNLDSASLAQA